MHPFSILAAALLLAQAPASEPLDVPNSKSPDERYAVFVVAPHAEGAYPHIDVLKLATKRVIGNPDAGGYISSADALRDWTVILWSPDSKYFACEGRTTKRSSDLKVYEVTPSGLTEIQLPSSTLRAFQLIKATETYRGEFQKPIKWVDGDTLLVMAHGDVTHPTSDGYPSRYEVEVTYRISSKQIIGSKVISITAAY